MCVYLHAKFEVSSIILTSFRQGVILPPPTSKRTPKKHTKIRVKETNHEKSSLTSSFLLKFSRKTDFEDNSG